MERLKFDPYAPVSCPNSEARHIGYSADNYSQPRQRSAEAVSHNVNPVTVSAVAPTVQAGLARAFIIPQESIYPLYEVCEGWRKGTIFVSLDKPLEGVTPCGRR